VRVLLFGRSNCARADTGAILLLRKDTLVGDWSWHWLLDSSGNEVGPIGDGDALAEFEDLYEKELGAGLLP
jgi:hypothetical protein